MAALFYDSCLASQKAVAELENIDDEVIKCCIARIPKPVPLFFYLVFFQADVFRIRFVKMRDPFSSSSSSSTLAEEFSLGVGGDGRLPALVYFRAGMPVVYHGDLADEDEVKHAFSPLFIQK